MNIDKATFFEPEIPRKTQVDLDQAIDAALTLLGRTKRLTILVNDPQRNTSTAPVLTLLGRRFSPADMRMLVATGTHNISADQRREHESQIRSVLPVEKIAWFDCRDAGLVRISGPVAWRGHRWLLESPSLLAIGSVEPHYFAGFTGAHKTATIGCASYDDIQANHSKALDPKSRLGALADNPVHNGIADMLKTLQANRPVAAVNLAQSGREILAAAGGEPLEALQNLLPTVRDAFIRHVAPADAIVAYVDGPLGCSFYQAEKGIKNNEHAVRDGGVIVLAAPCPDGIGQDQFAQLLREAQTYQAAMEIVQSRGYRLGDHKAVKLRYLTDPAHHGVRIFVVSDGISQEQADSLGVTKAATVEEALRTAGIDPARHAVYCVRDAGNLCLLPQ